MTREDVYERLVSVFRDVLDDDAIELNDNTVADDVTRLSNSYSFKHSEIFNKFLKNINDDFVVFMCK